MTCKTIWTLDNHATLTCWLTANALVMPNFDYCSSVWSNCSNELSNSLQILHNRLARIILSADIRTPVNDMMSMLKWNKLNDRWSIQMLVLIFKCIKGIAPDYLSSQFNFMHNMHSKGTRSQTNFALYEPSWNINAGKRTFQSRAAKTWNSLHADIRCNYESMSLTQFKNSTFMHFVWLFLLNMFYLICLSICSYWYIVFTTMYNSFLYNVLKIYILYIVFCNNCRASLEISVLALKGLPCLKKD